jgi:hypothetical protein
MHLTLVISGLLDAAPSALAAADASATALARILAAAGPPKFRPDGLPAVLCEALAIRRQSDWPVAPWRARANGIATGDAYWLCADPASMVVQRESVRLNGVVEDLASAEASSLLATLNAHFAGDGVRFHAPQPGNWLLQIDKPQRIETFPTDLALGRVLLEFLPQGPDGARWRRWQNEMQMLLFEHPVNRERESSRRRIVDSVWLWGGGVFEAPRPAPSTKKIYANVAWVRELAAGAGMTVLAVPDSVAQLLEGAGAAETLICLDTPPISESGEITALDRAWFQPLENVLRRRDLAAIDLVLTQGSRTMTFAVGRANLFGRWRYRWSKPSLLNLLAIERQAM